MVTTTWSLALEHLGTCCMWPFKPLIGTSAQEHNTVPETSPPTPRSGGQPCPPWITADQESQASRTQHPPQRNGASGGMTVQLWEICGCGCGSLALGSQAVCVHVWLCLRGSDSCEYACKSKVRAWEGQVLVPHTCVKQAWHSWAVSYLHLPFTASALGHT